MSLEVLSYSNREKLSNLVDIYSEGLSDIEKDLPDNSVRSARRSHSYNNILVRLNTKDQKYRYSFLEKEEDPKVLLISIDRKSSSRPDLKQHYLSWFFSKDKGSGFGSEALTDFVEQSIFEDYDAVSLQVPKNSRAKKLYERFGFKDISTSESGLVYMVLPLNDRSKRIRKWL